MNYRHSFHAGNFADLVKHALVLWLVKARQASGPVAVLDTHAGAGLYDLQGDATRSREAEAGVARLMTATDLPASLEALAKEVRALNPDGGVRWYPGSPVLVARALGGDDRYLGFEMVEAVQALLADALAPFPEADSAAADGYAAVVAAARAADAPLILIDPPFERADDYLRAAETAVALVRADAGATVAIWTPLKDLETFDGFLRRLDGVGPVLVAEARLRPLTDPMKMNGCAMVVVNPPPGTDAVAAEICTWVATALGEAGGRGEVWRL
ncbi:23S rRNA (adenine(2030)-N(6))-methyltransferase RlmJ [Brevundimonas sp.]|uniref:23S rRNA (adenine(2030)-N(6))-methyltransferase RlmJ n=1 Tax=Brevundimonas sp. TaxID=1871086 RepID=UPI001A195962|nr:23S rRNA (adenine(2030)-N(6))-methyltransferase RlmJ [Brevundimonas sp.]MBJ7485229.1 23S rRNA (adenine(2030)-N(6))-methyltransferase RlmJ [Brevundimonas sp.]